MKITNNKRKPIIIKVIILFTMIISLLQINTTSTRTFASGEVENTLGNLYINEEGYKDKMDNIATPYLEKVLQKGYIKGEEDLDIYYEKYIVQSSKGSIVISDGFSEYTGKYKELIYYFVQKGYSVFILDHRGQGNSGSLGVKDGSQINVEDYNYYISDFKSFLDEIVLPDQVKNEKLFLFCHSMGGGIGASFLEEYPEYFNAAILSAPMLQINTGNYPSFVAKLIAKTMNLIGLGDNYVFGQGKYVENNNVEESCTSSEERFSYSNNKLKTEDVYAQRGGASFRWLAGGFNRTKMVISEENAAKVKIPVLLFQAENDTYVEPEGQNEFQKNAQNCKLEVIKGAKHELYRENDDILVDYLNKVFEFYENNL